MALERFTTRLLNSQTKIYPISLKISAECLYEPAIGQGETSST